MFHLSFIEIFFAHNYKIIIFFSLLKSCSILFFDIWHHTFLISIVKYYNKLKTFYLFVATLLLLDDSWPHSKSCGCIKNWPLWKNVWDANQLRKNGSRVVKNGLLTKIVLAVWVIDRLLSLLLSIQLLDKPCALVRRICAIYEL